MRFLVVLASALLSAMAAAQTNRLTSARLNGDVLRLNVTDGVQAVRHFELPEPPRVVLDLFGIDRSVAEMPAPALDSPAIEVRTGEHPNFLRVVVDLTKALPAYEVRQSRRLIEVGLGPTALPPSESGILVGSSPVPADPTGPLRDPPPVVAAGIAASSAPLRHAQPLSPRTAPIRPQTKLLALIEAELEAAGLDQQQSAEERIEQAEAKLNANERRPTASGPPPSREPRNPSERSLRRAPGRLQATPPADGEERLPFWFVDEEPARPPPGDEEPR